MVLMGFAAVAIARIRDLFGATMLTSLFSLTGALIYVVLDAVDVAFTEAAVGAGVSTVLILGTIVLVGRDEKVSPVSRRRSLSALVVVTVTGLFLGIATFDMPNVGDPDATIHSYVAPRYLTQSGVEVGLPNVVTSVLASYRGYDTLGEVFVVFTAAFGVLTIIGRSAAKAPSAASATPPGPSSSAAPPAPAETKPARTTRRRKTSTAKETPKDGEAAS